MKITNKFPLYTEFSPKIKIWCVTPEEGRTIHRFFDSTPFSPSGRYMALFRMPFEDRSPKPGELGEIVLVDLQEGNEKTVAQTCGWETQLGANINWGIDDTQIIYNDVDTETWKPFAIRLNPFTGEKKRLHGCVYHVSHDGRHACSSNPTTRRRTQSGYGVVVPDAYSPVIHIRSEEEGLFVTDTQTGNTKLLLSMKEIFEKTCSKEYIEEKAQGECYVFHSKYSPSDKKIMFSTRWLPTSAKGRLPGGRIKNVRFNVFTCNVDGSGLQLSIPEEHWQNGGHHTTWHPNEEYLTMNIKKDWSEMRFAMARINGTEIYPVLDNVVGSGHPTFHPNGKFILTDTYVNDSLAFGDGTVPLRLVSLPDGKEETLVRINTYNIHQQKSKDLRVDPHPAWDKTFRYVAFNGWVDGTRRVFVADMKEYL